MQIINEIKSVEIEVFIKEKSKIIYIFVSYFISLSLVLFLLLYYSNLPSAFSIKLLIITANTILLIVYALARRTQSSETTRLLRSIILVYLTSLFIYLTGGLRSPLYVILPILLFFEGLSISISRLLILVSVSATFYSVFCMLELFSVFPAMPSIYDTTTIAGLPLSRHILFLISRISLLLAVSIFPAFLFNKLQEKITELKKTNRELLSARKYMVQFEKLASIGILVGGISHEIKTPLTSILGFAEFSLQKLIKKDPNLDSIKDYLKTIIQSADHSLSIIQDLLDYARAAKSDQKEMRLVDINSFIKSTVKIITHHMKIKNITIIENYCDKLPRVICNHNQIRQVLLNLLMNARDAIDTKGTITITSSYDEQNVMISIADTGCGMSEEVMAHIFEPFFTTKEMGKGTGLGLSISIGLMKEHNGDLKLQSCPGKGTTATIFIRNQDKKLC